MATKIVDVYDHAGERVSTYTVTLDDADCLDAEFEEMALILAESSGLIAANEAVSLRARCIDPGVFPASRSSRKQIPSTAVKGRVVSLVKRRMEIARAAQHRQKLKHQAS